jgi:hypothetical protein
MSTSNRECIETEARYKPITHVYKTAQFPGTDTLIIKQVQS